MRTVVPCISHVVDIPHLRSGRLKKNSDANAGAEAFTRYSFCQASGLTGNLYKIDEEYSSRRKVPVQAREGRRRNSVRAVSFL